MRKFINTNYNFEESCWEPFDRLIDNEKSWSLNKNESMFDSVSFLVPLEQHEIMTVSQAEKVFGLSPFSGMFLNEICGIFVVNLTWIFFNNFLGVFNPIILGIGFVVFFITQFCSSFSEIICNFPLKIDLQLLFFVWFAQQLVAPFLSPNSKDVVKNQKISSS